MSADNGVFIGKFGEGLEADFCVRESGWPDFEFMPLDGHEYNYLSVYQYFMNSPTMSEGAAESKARVLAENEWHLEHGIVRYDFLAWEKIVELAYEYAKNPDYAMWFQEQEEWAL